MPMSVRSLKLWPTSGFRVDKSLGVGLGLPNCFVS